MSATATQPARAPEVTLERALAYQNEAIPRRFMEDWAVSIEDARLLFDDVKRYLWANYTTRWQMTFRGPLGILDHMYHQFILFTKEYRLYCHDVYGEFVDHEPISYIAKQQQEAELAADPDGVRRQVLEERDWQRRVIAEKLGVDVLLRWYVDYALKYDDEFYATKHIPNKLQFKPDAALVELARQYRGS